LQGRIERIVFVPSLSLPEGPQPIANFAQYDAIRLFVERATAASANFSLTRRNGAAIVQVCQRLDGMPMALELAAARVTVLTVEQIAARLDQRLSLLVADNPAALAPRHQTLRAAIDWSYDLLSDQERVLFRRVAVRGLDGSARPAMSRSTSLRPAAEMPRSP